MITDNSVVHNPGEPSAEPEKKKRRRSPGMTAARKEIFRLLLRNPEYFLRKTFNGKTGHNCYKIYDKQFNPIKRYTERAVEGKGMKELFKEDDNKNITLHLKNIQGLSDATTIKKYYLEITEERKAGEDPVVNEKNKLPEMERSAVIADIYRYTLMRRWDKEKPMVMYIMLNPSTADADKDDPTIRSCIKLAREWGYGGIYVGNLFAFRATKPEDLLFDEEGEAVDKVGPENDSYLLALAKDSEKIIFAWGNHGWYKDRNEAVIALFSTRSNDLLCLKMTAEGHPWHPLFIGKTIIPQPFKISK